MSEEQTEKPEGEAEKTAAPEVNQPPVPPKEPRPDYVICYSLDQLAQACLDYAGLHGMVPFGRYRNILTVLPDGASTYVRLKSWKTEPSSGQQLAVRPEAPPPPEPPPKSWWRRVFG